MSVGVKGCQFSRPEAGSVGGWGMGGTHFNLETEPGRG